MRLLALFLFALLLTSCAGKPPAPKPISQTTECPALYVFAPGNYIMDIAGGADVVLDPGVQEFLLFCSPQETRKHINGEIAAQRLSLDDWRIYRLDGNFEDLVQTSSNGTYILKRMALAIDWVTE